MLTRESAVPLYEQLKRRLINQIASGELAQQSQLPSERRLVQELGVSRITVRKALGDLVKDGYLYAVPGKGFFVGRSTVAEASYELNALLSFSAAARARGVEPGSRILTAEIMPSPPAVVFQLQLAAGEPVIFLRRVRLLDGVAAVVQESWLPHAVCPGLLDEENVADLSLYTVLTERYGLDLARGHTVISARLATAEERDLLELSDPAAVLTVDQLTSTREGRPVELSNSVYHPHRYPLSIVHGDTAAPRGMATGQHQQAARWPNATVK